MNFLNLFKKISPKTKYANITLYLDKILVETLDQVKEGFYISSMKIAILPANCDNEVLGLKVREHLELTQHNLPIPKDYKQHYANYMNVAGFKTSKQIYQGALLVQVFVEDKRITIRPSTNEGVNGKNKGFTEIINEDIIIPCSATNIEIGESIKTGWTRCK